MAMIPIMGAVSAAVDYSRANVARSAMQAALDSTALMLSKEAQTLPLADAKTRATSYVSAIFTGNEAKNVPVASTLQNPLPGSYVLNVKGTAEVPTSFTTVFGQTESNISKTAEPVWGYQEA
ncbi:MAG: hypothetical protein GEU91_24015 [Rhizobiales bacterium]|nr:hypothetical protein [Hyphomicrobiales bacterium]